MRAAFSDPRLLASIAQIVRRHVPASDVDDIVQSALADAVASTDAPEEPEALRRWLSGVVKHKIADFHRRHHRRRELALDEAPPFESSELPSHEERDLLRWATRQLPSEGDAQKTLEWMMHEADGEKLEAIAERERMPAERVRQRVSRMRAFFRERWRHELAIVAAALTLAIIAWFAWTKEKAPPIAHDPVPTIAPKPVRAPAQLRAEATDACAKSAWRECLDKLDDARALDPAGETPELQSLRNEATRALMPAPAPSPSAAPLPAPTTSALPPVAPTSVPLPVPPVKPARTMLKKESTKISKPPAPLTDSTF